MKLTNRMVAAATCAIVVFPMLAVDAADNDDRPVLDSETHTAGDIALRTTNLGHFGFAPTGELSSEWQGNEYLHGAGLWVGAMRDGKPVVSTSTGDFEFRPLPDATWAIYESHEGIAGGDRAGLSPQPNDDGDDLTDEDFHNGLDDDLDGAIDEDYAAISDEMFSAQYVDNTIEAETDYPDHTPLDILVQERSYTWSTPNLVNTIVFDYRIHNVGDTILDDVFVGLYVDHDIGPPDAPNFWSDDGGGYLWIHESVEDPTIDGCRFRNIDQRVAYGFDYPDSDGDTTGDASGFVGLMVLNRSQGEPGVGQQSDVRRCRFLNGSEPYPIGDPTIDAERYELMSGTGTPVRETIVPADYRFYLGVGPFESIPPGEFVTVTFAYLIGEGRDLNGRPDGLRTAAIETQLAYDGVWMDLDGVAGTGTNGRETCLAESVTHGSVIEWEDPCDPGSVVTFPATTCLDPAMWVNADCDDCTPNPYQSTCDGGGCESRIRWFREDRPTPIDPTNPNGWESGVSPQAQLSCRPNPFGATANIQYRLTASSPVRLEIYDVVGRLVAQLVESTMPAGAHVAAWDGRDRAGARVQPGRYFARLESADGVRTIGLVRE